MTEPTGWNIYATAQQTKFAPVGRKKEPAPEPAPESAPPGPVPQPTFPLSAYGVNLTFLGDEGAVMAEGHVPLMRFVAAANRITRTVLGCRNLMDDADATAEDALDGARHGWVQPVAPHPEDEWCVRYDSKVTAATAGAIPVTFWEPW